MPSIVSLILFVKVKYQQTIPTSCPHLLPVVLGGICMTDFMQKIDVLIPDAARQDLWTWQGRSRFNKIRTTFCLTVALLKLRRFGMRV